MKIFFISIVIFLTALLIYMYFEAQKYKTRKISLKNNKIPPNFNNFKIVFLSDIHYGFFFKKERLQEIVSTINSLEPDLILLGGDYLDIEKNDKKYKQKYVNDLFNILSSLKSKQGIYTILGNHDYYHAHSLIAKSLEKNKIKEINNKCALIYNGSQCIQLFGIDDILEGNPNIHFFNNKKDTFSIVLCHNPDFFEEYKNDIDYDLGLSGHTHLGQVTFFGLYAPYTSSKYGQKYVKKLINDGHKTILVTSGIGSGLLPIRFFAPPEILLITLHPEGREG